MSKNNTIISNLQDFKKPRNLTLCGMHIALYLAIYSFNIEITPLIQLRFGFIILAAAGFVGGPIMGLTVGALGDIISMILLAGKSGGSFFFGFTLSYALMGFLCGFIFYNSKVSPIRVALASMTEFMISIILNTYWLSVMTGSNYKALLISRLPKSLVMLLINIIMLYGFMRTMSVALKKVLHSA